MSYNRLLTVFASTVGLAASAQATVLTFDGIGGTGTPIPANYGDRVAATNQGGFGYGAGNGFTPNIVVDYAPVAGIFAIWASGYGNLVNALGHSSFNVPGEVSFVPDPGSHVRLNSFLVASWNAGIFSANFRIWDDNGSFASPNLFSTTMSVSGAGSFSPLPSAVVGQGTVHLYSNVWGSIGLDNVDFDQVQAIPVPVFPYDSGSGAHALRAP